MSDLLPIKKDTMKSIRFKQETIEFLEKIGPVATVARAIIEKSIKNWDNFESINLERKKDISLHGLPMDIVNPLVGASLRDRDDIIFYVNHVGVLNHIDGIGLKSVDKIMKWLEV